MSRSTFFWVGWSVFFLITGGLGACALCPLILTVATYTMVVPGLVLCLNANLFLWGCFFFSTALLGRKRSYNTKLALHSAAIALLIALIVLVPSLLNLVRKAQMSSVMDGDRPWSGSLSGITTLALLEPATERSSPVCSPQCRELLYSGTFAAIIVGDAPGFDTTPDATREVARFRLEHRASCPAEQENCIVQDRARLSDAGAAWITTEFGAGYPRKNWAERRSLQLYADGTWTEVFRTTRATVQHVMTPLLLAPQGRPSARPTQMVSLQLLSEYRPIKNNPDATQLAMWEIPGVPESVTRRSAEARQ